MTAVAAAAAATAADRCSKQRVLFIKTLPNWGDMSSWWRAGANERLLKDVITER
jgi:hypothetical protein